MGSLVLNALIGSNSPWIYTAIPAIIVLALLIPYYFDAHYIRANGITGPILARFSDAWLGWVAAHGHRSEVVHEQHKKYGTFVRLAPNHVSVNNPEAFPIIYGHGNGTLKSGFYDPFISIRANIFTTRSRTDHARKRKIVSHVFSQKSILEFEPYIRLHIGELLEQWDKLCERAKTGLTGSENEGSWEGHAGRVWLNCMLWFNYWAFDIIGDMAFGSSFGMVRKARDAAPIAADQKATMAKYGQSKQEPRVDDKTVFAVKEVPAIEILNKRSRCTATLGVLTPWWRPIAQLFPQFASGGQATDDLAGMAVAAVAKRLAFPTDRNDLLSKLLEGKDEGGKPMGKEELTAEAFVQLVAGSDTTSSSSCAITYYIASNLRVQAKLQKELDEALGASDDPVTTYEQIKRLPYLEAAINEGMRIHTTSGIGLPRVVPEGGLTVCGKTFPEGTVLSIPAYSVHRDPDVWGADVDVFRPERWFEHDQAKIQKAFNPFSFGPRACIGRNVAMTELLIIISSIFRRYDLVLEQPNVLLQAHEGLIRRPNECRVGMKRRDL